MRAPFPISFLLLALLVTGSIITNSLAQDSGRFEKGAVIPQVTSQTDNRHTYALYLPTGYTPARKWPVLFAFDPGARGQVPVERFREAAEKYGYIVMGSNNSRNGPVQVEFEAMRALYSDARRRFSVDENRLYSTGFSGAARVATKMGLMLKGIAGAIIVGGGFPLGVKPSAEVAFTLYGIAGEADLNFNEMLRLHRDFTGLGIPNHFEVLPGGHQWPSSEVLMEAIEWMELQAMRKGMRPPDPALVAALLTARIARAEALEAKGELAAAFRSCGEISKDFNGLADLKVVETSVARLKAQPQLSKAMKDVDKRDGRMEKRDDLQTEKLTEVLNFIFSTGGVNFTDGRAEVGSEAALRPGSTSLGNEGTQNRDGLRPETANDAMALEKLVEGLGIASLNNTIGKKPGTDDAILAERQKSRIFISTFESARMLIEVKKYAQAVMCLEITC
jgi:predicted esterase